MTVENNESRNQYIATGGQTVFPYTFEIFTKSDIAVYSSNVELSEGVDFTVSDVGNDNGGSVTLTSGAVAGVVYTIFRDMPLDRLNDYQQSGDFLADEVNDDFDRLWLAISQQKAASDLSIRGQVTDSILTSENTLLPVPASRAGTVLGFDSSGVPAYYPLGSKFPFESTTAQLILSTGNYDIGSHIVTTAYDDGLNGGDGDWVKTAATGAISQSPSDLVNAQLTDATGAVWELNHGGTIKLPQLGAVIENDVGPEFLAYAGSAAVMLDLEGLVWDCRSLNAYETDIHTALDNKVFNGTLTCTNSLDGDTDIKNLLNIKEDGADLVETKSRTLVWPDLEVLWLGTSIPHEGAGTDGYPERFGAIMECGVDNLAWSGSHAFYDILGDAFDSGTIRALSMTEADRLAGLALYGPTSAYDDSFNTITLASEMTADYRIERLFQEKARDVVMLDHNHNDRLNVATYTENRKVITGVTVGTTTLFNVEDTTGLEVGGGCYVRVVGIDDLNNMAGRISAVTETTVTVAFNSTGFTGTATGGSFRPVDRNTIRGAFDFLIAYIKNCSVRYGNGDVQIVLCNAPSNYTNLSDPDYGIWHSGRAIKEVADWWKLPYFDVAYHMRITIQDQTTYLTDNVHPQTSETRKLFADHWTQWARGGINETYNSNLVLQQGNDGVNEHNAVAIFTKYDDGFAARTETYDDGEVLINDNFSSGLAGWSTPDATPTVVAAPWDGAEFAVEFDSVIANTEQRITQSVALGAAPSLAFDFWFTDNTMATGVSQQIVMATINASGISYSVTLVQSVGQDARLAIKYNEGGSGLTPISSLPFNTFIISPSTRYTFSYEIIAGYVYFSVNGVKLYAGPFRNSLLTSQTSVELGVVFTNMGSDFNIWIGNVVAKNKTLFPVGTLSTSNQSLTGATPAASDNGWPVTIDGTDYIIPLVTV